MAASVVTTTFALQNSDLNEPYGDSTTIMADSINTPSTTNMGSAEISSQSADLPQNNTAYKIGDLMVGLPSFSDVAERKLQLSLDELIHQQLQQEGKVKTTTSSSHTKNKKNIFKHQRPTGNSLTSRNISSGNNSVSNMKATKKFARVQPYTPVPMIDPYYMNGILHEGYSNQMAAPGFEFASTLPYKQHCVLNTMPTLVAPVQAPFGPIMNPNKRREFHVLSQGVENLALSDVEILYPPPSIPSNPNEAATEENALIIRFKGTDVLKVRKTTGDIVMNSGGWKTMSTLTILNCALKPIGLSIKSADEKKTSSGESVGQKKPSADWLVTDGMAYLANFKDGMVISQVGGRSHSHLLARASVIAQHMKQAKSSAMSRRQMSRRAWRNT